MAAVLRQLAVDGLGTDPSRRYVSFPAFARRIAERVEAMPGLPQRVHATPLDPAQDVPELPFFPNPRFVDDPQRMARQAIESPLRSFLDELDDVFDAEHFLGRVGSHFAGRRRQLRTLARWMDGAEPTSGLRVVTGSPGVGKSALLGALVCAAHPVLAAAVPHVRTRLEAAGCPSRNPYLGAVHARQRRVPELVDSLVRQFGLPQPSRGRSVSGLIAELAGLPVTPVVVVDAVDEALDPNRMIRDFLMPLISARQLDDTPVCRLLVGFRPWPEFRPIRKIAAQDYGLTDLDTVERAELRSDLGEYMQARLADVPGYDSAVQRPVRERLADTIADRLVDDQPTPSEPEWGAFLVAGMFAGYLDHLAPVTSLEKAEQLGATTPRSLPEVLELELGTRPDRAELRATLAAVAHAVGEGAPAEVVGFLAEGFCGTATEDQVRSSLDAVRFYLRTTVEQDGTTLYRLLHQSLADYLRRHPMSVSTAETDGPEDIGASSGAVFDRLLGAIRSGRWGSWSSVPPYLLRHVIHHAIEAGRVDELLLDIEFLLHADGRSLLPELHRAKGAAARLRGDMYSRARQSWAFRDESLATRRWILAIEAARHGDAELGRKIASEIQPNGWVPRWASTLPFADERSWVTAVASSGTGRSGIVVAAGSDGRAWRLDMSTGERIGKPFAGSGGSVSAVALADLDGRRLAVTGGADGTVRAWDTATGNFVGSAGLATGWINAITCAEVNGHTTMVVCGDEAVRFWDPSTGAVRPGQVVDHRWSRAIASTSVDGRPIAVTVSNDHAVRIWDLTDGTPLHPPSRDHRDRVYAVACTVLDGDPVAVTAGDDFLVRLWNLRTGRSLRTPLSGHSDWIAAVVCTEIGASPTAISGGFDRTVRVWDLDTGLCTEVMKMPAPVWALDITSDGGLVICTGQDVLVLDRLGKGC
ncbi:hypothetical protein AVR91_0216625 [Amycolatopsis keratiniphila subsp. keratiniphila]|uniref:Uncharacterized protein n=1 Tax=Amycolatopsis keratiniphila subsp. keratiniphila TaxID=227715 RepID=A0A1W2LWM7_9PSEU|nr:hypothetical protein AVR91_0216625 [Amycolatopsis keratiniphila subsp. keratiniphila]